MIRSEMKVTNGGLTFKTASLWGAQYESKILKQQHDIVIIDTPPKIESDARPAIEASDLVLIPISPSPVDFWATEPIIEIAQRAKKRIVIQINRANPRAKLMKKTYAYIKDLGMEKTNTLIGHRQIFVASMGEGKTVIEKQKKGKAAKEIAELSSEIYSTLH